MKISTEIYSTARHVGEEKAIELLAKAGFDCWDFSMFEMVRVDWRDMSIIDTGHPLSKSNYADFAKKLRKAELKDDKTELIYAHKADLISDCFGGNRVDPARLRSSD